MDVNPQEILKYVKSQERYAGEISSYWESMKKLPLYDYSKFYTTYPDYANIITQGDVIGSLSTIKLPDPTVYPATGIILSNTCDIAPENKRKFSSRIIYAPLLVLEAYIDLLKSAEDEQGNKEYSDKQIGSHIDDLRNQKVSQVFYLPKDELLSKEALIFFDTLCSTTNESVKRDDLSEKRLLSLSAYGWHIFLEKLAHFFTKMSDDSVELRFKSQ